MTANCPSCGSTLEEGARFCAACGRPLEAAAPPSTAPPAPPPVYSASGPPPAAGVPQDDTMAKLIPFRNMPALIGYYLGVFSLIPCFGLPLGIAAIPLGIVGLRKHRETPTVRGTAHAWTAIILGSLSLLLWGVLPLAFGLFGSLFD